MDFKELYRDPKFTGSFSGQQRFHHALNKDNVHVSKSSVNKRLMSVDSYTVHKPTRKTKVFRRIYTKGINYLLQCDLVDLSSLHKDNDGYKWIITIIDTFSKKAWAFKMKNKSANSIVSVMKPFFQSVKPQKIQFDQGTEFYNKAFLKLLRDNRIKHYSVYSEQKAAIVERFNRSLKTRMFRYFTSRGSHRWVDVLQDLIDGYNNSKHRSTSFAPNDVTSAVENVVRKKLYPKIKKEKEHSKPKFKVGDTVRITRKKGIFEKGFDMNWSWEVFKISQVKVTYPVTYGLTDYKGKEIKGSFYKNELQLVDKSDNIWPIEKIVKTRKIRNQLEYLVKFLGYPNEANTWISHQALFNV
jgi:transposase InsO family protein